MASILTVRSPWAELIVSGHKTVECRNLRTHFRGRLYIHAAGRPWVEPRRGFVRDYLNDRGLERPAPARSLILGAVEVVDCLPADEVRSHLDHADRTWAIPGFGWYWVLRDPQPLPEPIPFTAGQLGIYKIPDELVTPTPKPTRRKRAVPC